MNFRTRVFGLFFLSFAGATSAQGQSSAHIGCEAGGENQDGCYLTWNLSIAGKDHHFLEKFQGDDGRWSVVGERLPSAGSTGERLAPGSLVRVVGCDSDAAKQCVSTDVFWVPLKPTSPSDIPAVVEPREGAAMAISKNTRLYTQTLQYNVYLLAAELEAADWTSMPEMIPPPRNLKTVDDYIHANVWMSYTAARNDALDIAGDPASVEPEIGRAIHPEGHPSPAGKPADEN